MIVERRVLEKLSKKAVSPENYNTLLKQMESMDNDDLLLIVQKKYKLANRRDLRIGLTLIDKIDGWECTLRSKSSIHGVWNAHFMEGPACFFEREADLYLIEK